MLHCDFPYQSALYVTHTGEGTSPHTHSPLGSAYCEPYFCKPGDPFLVDHLEVVVKWDIVHHEVATDVAVRRYGVIVSITLSLNSTV